MLDSDGCFRLTLRQRYRDDHSVAGADPQPVRGNEQSGDAHEGKSQFSRTEHLADVRLYVDVLEMLIGMSVIEP